MIVGKKIRDWLRHWLGIEDVTYKYATTRRSGAAIGIEEALKPIPPALPGSWELVAACIVGGTMVIYWWRMKEKN